ncbi:heme utilization protein HutZ [Psychromonas marina]|uniref:Heme utilization protein HutZ n=1 Tax=Psychromonas marina TaxID=88364 RepID=A0ABQ6E1F0_9GAMM|nr:heme utilization protein HutZ [Psychromonas marina]GLS91074.1 heme utilization protein HutZ [Psychromonas marina]
MIDKQARLQGRLIPEIHEFREHCQSLQLATLNDGLPHASYAPFAYTEAGYFILISDIAQHGQNLKTAKSVAFMMLDDESAAKSIFARRRLSYESQANCIDKKSDLGVQGLNALEARFGDMIPQLSQLNDFNLYQLKPLKGRYVKGFGKAFELTGDELQDITHLQGGHNNKGHG